MTIGVIALATLGWLAAIPAALWWTRDTRHISRRTWYWSGHDKRAWTRGIIYGLVAFGWPAIVVVLVWRLGEQRAELMAEVVDLREHQSHEHTRRATERAEPGPTNKETHARGTTSK